MKTQWVWRHRLRLSGQFPVKDTGEDGFAGIASMKSFSKMAPCVVRDEGLDPTVVLRSPFESGFPFYLQRRAQPEKARA
jgi:hypothetical protein